MLLDGGGNLTEGIGSNVFIVEGGRLVTPRAANVLAGVSRQTVLDLAAKCGIPASEGDINLYHAYNADEAFVTGTGAEIVAAVAADGRKIGDGKPGPITRKLVEAFRHTRTRDGAKVVYAGAV